MRAREMGTPRRVGAPRCALQEGRLFEKERHELLSKCLSFFRMFFSVCSPLKMFSFFRMFSQLGHNVNLQVLRVNVEETESAGAS